ncbi:hypothetical protein [Scardovia inopinata]|nr:hypothetical protein [Scardovia inopinata]BAR07365.1 hypothetical protein SCIP_1298 [Scardovia inopinata JCM 12537]
MIENLDIYDFELDSTDMVDIKGLDLATSSVLRSSRSSHCEVDV